MRGQCLWLVDCHRGGALSRHDTPTEPKGPLGRRLRDVGGVAHPRVAGMWCKKISDRYIRHF